MAVFSIKITVLSFQEPTFSYDKKSKINFLPLRRDIVDRNGEILSRNVKSYHAAVKPNLIKNKENFTINIKFNFPEISQNKLTQQLSGSKYFYLKKRLTDKEKVKIWSMGEKGIKFEPYQARIYPHGDLFSHIIGQIDEDNYGVSGIERYLDSNLIDIKKIHEPLKLSLDSNIQYLVKNELNKSIENFKANGAAALLMDSKTGEILSLVSLPDYNINIRKSIKNKKYTNKITKNLYELGSVFKTFAVASALDEGLLEPNSKIENITKKIKCSKYEISDIHEFPKTMSVEDILIQSSNVGSLKIARIIGEEKYRAFLKKLNLFSSSEIELDEISTPSNLKWNKCKLETVSFGHGIMITPLQLATAYAAISNGGYAVKPTLIKVKNDTVAKKKRILKEETSIKMRKILRKVVTDEKGTASFANIFGYEVGGKTGTAQNYQKKDENINTFISVFPISNPKYVFLVILDDPKPAPHIVYNYKGKLVTNINRNEAGWNSVYVAGKIIEKIGPILAINNDEVYNNHVVNKIN